MVFRSPALLAPLRLHFLHPRHRFATAPSKPPGLHAEDSWIGLVPLLADVFPLRPVVKAPAMTTLTLGTLLTCKIVMVHNNSPFWPPVFLGAIHNDTRNQKKVKGNKKAVFLPVLILKIMDSWIKKFSFLLSKSPICFCPENPIRISRRAKRGEPKPLAISYVVPGERLELSRACAHKVINLACLPFHHPGLPN